ncbi:MAG: efflux RND transporter periplasmic adaptor subunit, partial [Planctomycetota bacterium]
MARDLLRRVLRHVVPLGILLLCTVVSGCGSSDEVAGPDEEAGNEGHAELANEVALRPEMLETVGIQTAEAGPDTVKIVLRLTASVVENLDTQVHVTPRVGGTIKALSAKLGETVAKGDALCVIDSVDFGNAVAAYLKARAAMRAAES